jgi:hypothetical protein
MLRLLIISMLGLACTGCAGGVSNYKQTRLDLRESSYIFVERHPRYGLCYTRVLNAQPADQVCHRRSVVRYSTDPKIRNNPLEPVPEYVLALFETVPDGRLERASGQQR